jgi:hypothetical protein
MLSFAFWPAGAGDAPLAPFVPREVPFEVAEGILEGIESLEIQSSSVSVICRERPETKGMAENAEDLES